jgi:hypothetical protein
MDVLSYSRPACTIFIVESKRRQVKPAGADLMSKATHVLRNSLILLACGAVIPTAWAAETLAPGTSPPPEPKVHFSVPFQAPADAHVLDLKAPDVRDVMTPDELAAATAPPEEFEILGPETVAVHGAPQPVYVPGGFAALYWAAIHPLSAWRILAPVQ